MAADFISGDTSIPTSTTTSLDYHSPIGLTVLISVVVIFLICSFVVFVQHCFAIHHHEQTAATPFRPRVRSGSSVAAQPPPGLDASVVETLPVVRYTGGGEGCAVCLVEYVDKEKVKVIPGCGHGFHLECIDTWLMRRGSCPVCRCSEMWGTWSGEVCAGVFGCGERNGGKLSRSRSCDRRCSEVEAGGRGGGQMLLRRTCSV